MISALRWAIPLLAAAALLGGGWALLALVRLALGVGEGADAQAPLARAVLGGLAASTLITLVLIPVVYSLMHRDRTGHGKTPDHAVETKSSRHG